MHEERVESDERVRLPIVYITDAIRKALVFERHRDRTMKESYGLIPKKDFRSNDQKHFQKG